MDEGERTVLTLVNEFDSQCKYSYIHVVKILLTVHYNKIIFSQRHDVINIF